MISHWKNISRSQLIRYSILIYWSLFWLLNIIDKIIGGSHFLWVGRDRFAQFQKFFASAGIESPVIADFALVIAAALEAFAFVFFTGALLKLLKNNTETCRSWFFIGISLTLATFTIFSIGDHVFGDRFELLEHTLFWFLTLFSWVVFNRLENISENSPNELNKKQFIGAGIIALFLIGITSFSIFDYNKNFFSRRTDSLSAVPIGENIYNHYEKGKSPIRAAIDGTLEVIPPVVSAILTTIIAFSTFFFLDGRLGDFFGEVALIVIITLSVSLIEAIIILPAHIAHSKALERKGKKRNKINTFFYNVNEKAEIGLFYIRDHYYAPFLRFFLKHKLLGFAIPIALLIFSIGGLGGGIVKTAFFPSIASDRVSIDLKMLQGTNEKITDSIISKIEKVAWEVNEEFTGKQISNEAVIQNIIKRIGPGSANGSLTINLLPGEARDFSSSEITNAIRDKVGQVIGVESLTYGSGGNFGGSPVAVSLLGNNIEELKDDNKRFVADYMNPHELATGVIDSNKIENKENELFEKTDYLKSENEQLRKDLEAQKRAMKNSVYGLDSLKKIMEGDMDALQKLMKENEEKIVEIIAGEFDKAKGLQPPN